MTYFFHNRMVLAAALMALLVLMVGADGAWAAGGGTVGGFSCSGGRAVGQLYISEPSCPTTLSIDNFFSFLICNMEQLSSNIMGNMYCGMIVALSPLVWACATLAIIFFGVGFTFGIVPMRGGEAILFLLKIAFITGFATSSELLVGTAYNLLISGIRDGVTIVLEGIGGTTNSGSDMYSLLDGFLAQAFHFATDGLKGTTAADKCKNAVFAVMATMAIAFPMLFYLGLTLMGRIALTFFRAVFGYVYALVGITFLMTLAPIFCSFALFKATKSFFDKWVGYMVSFALQIVLVFSFLGFVMMIDISNMTSNLTSVIMADTKTYEANAMRFPWQYCTLCQFKVVSKADHTSELPKDANILNDGELKCKDSPPKPIGIAFAAAPDETKNTLSSLMVLAGKGIISLLALAVLVEQLLNTIPRIGQRLAAGLGGAYAPNLAGPSVNSQGQVAMPGFSLPGESFIKDFSQSFGGSMRRGVPQYDPSQKGSFMNTSGDAASSAVRAVKDGISTMVTGKDSRGQVTKDAGIPNRFKSWLSDPSKFGE